MLRKKNDKTCHLIAVWAGSVSVALVRHVRVKLNWWLYHHDSLVNIVDDSPNQRACAAFFFKIQLVLSVTYNCIVTDASIVTAECDDFHLLKSKGIVKLLNKIVFLTICFAVTSPLPIIMLAADNQNRNTRSQIKAGIKKIQVNGRSVTVKVFRCISPMSPMLMSWGTQKSSVFSNFIM